MVPILLRSFGRSGSTLVMQLLGTSPNIIFDREYPYEKRHLTYLYRLALLPGKEVNNDGLWNTESLIHKGVDRVGPLPFNTSIINRGKLGADLFRID